MQSDRQLRRWYNRLNKKWFGDKLPKDAIVRYEVVDGRNIAEVELQNDGRWLLRIHPAIAWAPRNAEFSLLHEMAHLSSNDMVHGRKFNDEMLRLANAGAFKRVW